VYFFFFFFSLKADFWLMRRDWLCWREKILQPFSFRC